MFNHYTYHASFRPVKFSIAGLGASHLIQRQAIGGRNETTFLPLTPRVQNRPVRQLFPVPSWRIHDRFYNIIIIKAYIGLHRKRTSVLEADCGCRTISLTVALKLETDLARYIKLTRKGSSMKINRFSVRLRVLEDNLQHRDVGAAAIQGARCNNQCNFFLSQSEWKTCL
jgi:hypothetical protein